MYVSFRPIIRPAFDHVFEYCQSAPCPVMALTANATPSLKQNVIKHLNDLTQAVASVNQKNIYYSCYELKLQPQGLQTLVIFHVSDSFIYLYYFFAIGDDRYTEISKTILPHISSKDQRIIIYIDFVKDAAPLAISLCQAGFSTCSYHGQDMSTNDKWNPLRIGEVVLLRLWSVQLLLA